MTVGDAGKNGSVGPQGPPGPPGVKGQRGLGLSGVNYVRWGRTNCSGDATVVYNGKKNITVNGSICVHCTRHIVL